MIIFLRSLPAEVKRSNPEFAEFGSPRGEHGVRVPCDILSVLRNALILGVANEN